MQQSPKFTSKHRVVRIDYCWDDFNEDALLTGVRTTVGIFGRPSTYIPLNTYGTIAGTCSTFTPIEGEEITDI